jgi:hypothetical protein
MISTSSRNFLSFVSVVLFFIVAVASKTTKLNQLPVASITKHGQVEDTLGNKNFVEKTDGKKIYGGNISWKKGALVKDVVEIDNQKIPFSQVKGYMLGGNYYRLLDGEMVQRIIRGKVNVYYYYDYVTSYRDGKSVQRLDVRYYYQLGDKAEIEKLLNSEHLKALFEDCPAAYAYVDMKQSKLKKILYKETGYLNKAFELYNNNCKPLQK